MIDTHITPDRLARLQKEASAFEHVVLVTDVPNQNGRTYPKNVVVDAVSRVTYPLFGTFMSDLSGGSIPLDKISHEVLDLRIVGDQLIAKITILKNLQYGKVLQNLTDAVGEQDYRVAGQCLVDPVTGIVSGFYLLSIGALARGTGA